MLYRTVVRTPPTAFPFASSVKTTGETWVVAKRWAEGGGVPFTTHLLSQWTAASSAQCVPPVLMGSVQLTHPRECASGLHGSQVLYCTLTVPGVVGTDGEAVIVVVRGARDLPESEPRAVGQSGSRCRRRFRSRTRGPERRGHCGSSSASGLDNWSAVLGRVERRCQIGCARGSLGSRAQLFAVPNDTRAP